MAAIFLTTTFLTVFLATAFSPLSSLPLSKLPPHPHHQPSREVEVTRSSAGHHRLILHSQELSEAGFMVSPTNRWQNENADGGRAVITWLIGGLWIPFWSRAHPITSLSLPLVFWRPQRMNPPLNDKEQQPSWNTLDNLVVNWICPALAKTLLDI